MFVTATTNNLGISIHVRALLFFLLPFPTFPHFSQMEDPTLTCQREGVPPLSPCLLEVRSKSELAVDSQEAVPCSEAILYVCIAHNTSYH